MFTFYTRRGTTSNFICSTDLSIDFELFMRSGGHTILIYGESLLSIIAQHRNRSLHLAQPRKRRLLLCKHRVMSSDIVFFRLFVDIVRRHVCIQFTSLSMQPFVEQSNCTSFHFPLTLFYCKIKCHTLKRVLTALKSFCVNSNKTCGCQTDGRMRSTFCSGV